MSFSSIAKNEISRLPIEEKCCSLAELAAIIRMSGTIQISGLKNISLKFATENAAIARRIFVLLKTIYDAELEVMVRRNKQLKKNNNYLVMVQDTEMATRILQETGIIADEESSNYIAYYSISDKLIEKRCCKRAYIRGAFLGGGSISNPEKSYHMEFVTNSKDHSTELLNIINSFDLNSRIVLRKGNYVVYLKEGEQIADVLNIIGAHQALLKFENIRVYKDVRNNVNRIVNCETANLSKTIDASLRQVENIEYIGSKVGINKLPNNLKEVARLRLENRDASLKELGAMLNPPIGKSGINHRFKKIEDYAEELKRKNNDD